ncbi:MAG: biotin transporter BioY [Dehalococcoidia bacterium]
MQSIAVPSRIASAPRVWGLVGPAERSLFEVLFPSATVLHKALAAVAFIAIIAGMAKMRFFLPENPVPIALTGFGVMMAGGVMGWRWGLASVTGYYLVGMAGAPVFVDGQGWQYVTGGVTGGYLIGFILQAGAVGFLVQRGWSRGRALWPMMIGTIAVYVPALIWLSVMDLGWPAQGEMFSSAVYPFIPGDLVKLMLAAMAVGALWRYADYRNASR